MSVWWNWQTHSTQNAAGNRVGSNPTTGTNFSFLQSFYILDNNTRMWLSLVERLVWDQDVAGSNPVIRTIWLGRNCHTQVLALVVAIF